LLFFADLRQPQVGQIRDLRRKSELSQFGILLDLRLPQVRGKKIKRLAAAASGQNLINSQKKIDLRQPQVEK